MKAILSILALLSFCAVGSAKEPEGNYHAQVARSNILAALPKGWSVFSPPWQQDRITTAYFTHPQTEAFLLLGSQSNHIDWTDRNGISHREYLANECLYVWIVPADFKPQFPGWSPHRGKLPERVYASRGIQVYADVSHHITDTNRMDTIMKEATRISSPEIRLSWRSWQRDIATSLKK